MTESEDIQQSFQIAFTAIDSEVSLCGSMLFPVSQGNRSIPSAKTNRVSHCTQTAGCLGYSDETLRHTQLSGKRRASSVQHLVASLLWCILVLHSWRGTGTASLLRR